MRQHKIYFMMRKNKILYIGYSTNLPGRIPQHRGMSYTHIRWIVCKSKDSALRYESRWIRKFKPKYNGIHGNQPLNVIKKTVDIPRMHVPSMEKAALLTGQSVKSFIETAAIAATLQTLILKS